VTAPWAGRLRAAAALALVLVAVAQLATAAVLGHGARGSPMIALCRSARPAS